MRRCRYAKCGNVFQPRKDFYVYCSWDCRMADVGPNYECDYRGYQRSSDQRYGRGFADGARANPSSGLQIPAGIWKGMLIFCHPDKHQADPGLLTLATEVTRWLIEHRPAERS